LESADDGRTNIRGSVSVSDEYIPELDITYFITKHIAAELVLAAGNHDVTVKESTLGDVDLGKVRLLPPVLALQYHFLPDGKFRPYIGAGINYTITFDEDEGSGGGGAAINNISYSNEFGYAFQIGMDIGIKDNWFVNVDLKKVFVQTDISVNDGAIISDDTDLDPWIFGIGFGYRF